jgi:mannose-6-phosphate isomerase
MYRLPVTPGDVIYLPAGTLHAIGPGCMIAEVQEPTDFTISLDTQFAGQPLSDAQRFLGLSLEQALTAVRTTPLDALALARNRRIHGSGRSPQRGAARVTSLTRPIGDVSGDKFWVELAAAGPEDELDHAAYGALALGIVTSGAGQLCGTHGGDSLGVHQGDGFVLPAGLGAWRATSSAGLRLILCGPQPSTAASIARAGRA